jgi:hypothetical protein
MSTTVRTQPGLLALVTSRIFPERTDRPHALDRGSSVRIYHCRQTSTNLNTGNSLCNEKLHVPYCFSFCLIALSLNSRCSICGTQSQTGYRDALSSACGLKQICRRFVPQKLATYAVLARAANLPLPQDCKGAIHVYMRCAPCYCALVF